MDSDELSYMSAAEIADHVRRLALSPVEIVEACIARIERRNPSLNAFVYKGFEDARAAARAAERAVMSGAETGPLHGVPTAIKDLFDFKPGWPFTFGGIRAMKDCIAQWHCVFAERVEKAGAILLGKTNSPTMGLRGTCDNYLFGPTRNPFDVRKNRAGLPAAAPPRSPMASSRLPREPTPAARSVSRRPGATSSASRPRSAAFPS
jgi:amidase/aspartyl-tRNA(Asn)/glutamyl-tRNA(Gln) amidotransferase subunit A